MSTRNRSKYSLVILAILLGTSLPACGAQSTQEEGIVSQQQAEHELVTFMLDYLLSQEIPKNLPYIPPEERATSGPTAVVSIIIQAPPGEDPEPGENPLDLTQPVRVWLYKDNQLYEAIDTAETIAQYRQDHMNFQVSQTWGFYDFGIISISEDGQQAKLFWEVSCGIDCGHGYLYILERSAQGKWEITGSEWGWIA